MIVAYEVAMKFLRTCHLGSDSPVAEFAWEVFMRGRFGLDGVDIEKLCGLVGELFLFARGEHTTVPLFKIGADCIEFRTERGTVIKCFPDSMQVTQGS